MLSTLLAPRSGITPQQQPEWDDPDEVMAVRDRLARRPGLCDADDVLALRGLLAGVAAREAVVIQAGDCAEDPSQRSESDVRRKVGLLDLLAGLMAMNTRRPVVRVGRIAGQYAKPRSRPTETVGGIELPSFRGHLVNRPEADAEARRPDPQRLLEGHHAAGEVLGHLGWTDRNGPPSPTAPTVWSSHEALLMDYELPQMQIGRHGLMLASTHWPWIGDRTRGAGGPHVDLLAAVVNPVACKVGPTMSVDELLELCDRLDPRREPGRLTFIARMGAERATELLPALVEAVRLAGHPVIWLCDPMHGNTVTTSHGLKTRYVEAMVREVRAFQRAVRAAGGVDGGLHLESTPDPVTECVSVGGDENRVGDSYTTLCDPRLNPAQAEAVVGAWTG